MMQASAKAKSNNSSIGVRVIRANGKIEDHGIVAGGRFKDRFMSKLRCILRGY